ncbi:MAG: cysteine desulfurase NifS [bacterium]|nr:cysteine desulfurase NifS [bacterium]MDD5353660.1 cysteine desulfurase NifS [bacterium]MDD5756491.1 cysteine desulfurase NifS [bacterium]
MDVKRRYFDYAATTPMHPEVIKSIQPYFDKVYGNPSSLHIFGQEAQAAITQSRDLIAKYINAKTEEIIFTSGGTEADNFALIGVFEANAKKGNHIITTNIEHHAILETCKFLEKHRGAKITYVPVDKYGLVDLEAVIKAITPQTILISVMHANNEIGTIEPIAGIGKVAKEKGIYFHTDAVQTFGSLDLDVEKLNIDLLSASAHKLYGPKGVGLLYIRKGVRILPFLHGGEQERRRRASTENVPGIVGFGKAVELAIEEKQERHQHVTILRDKLIKGILEKINESELNGHPTKRLPNNVNVTVKYIEGESMLINLDLEGIAASTGSACSSSSLEPSHVIKALGVSPEVAHSSLRFSLGRLNTDEDVDYLLEALPRIVKKLREMSPLYKKK